MSIRKKSYYFSLALSFFLLLFSIGSKAQTFSNGTNFAIPDANATGISSVINVSGLGTSLNCTAPLGIKTVCIKIAHPFDGDLDIYLVSPTGTTVMLSTDNGAGGDNYGNATADDLGPYTCFDMSAATAVTAGAAPFAGTYIPEGSFAAFNNGQNPNGNWTLRVYDDAGGDVGTLLYWQLTFATTGLTCPAQGDFCTFPLTLTPAASCTYTAGNTTGFSNSGQGCGAGTNDDDIWYSFVATATSHTITVDGAADFDAVLGAYNSCGGTQPTGGGCVDLTGSDGIETITISGLTIGVTYYITVHDFAAGGGNFNICIIAPPANDACAGATLLTSNSTCSTTAGSTSSGYSNSGQGCAAGTNDDDIWYSFVAAATTETITVNGAANFDAVVGAYTSCGGGQPTGGACVDATGSDGIETLNLTGLTIGVTYYIAVHDFAIGGGDFTICVVHPGPPNCATYTGPADGAETCNTPATLTWTAPTTGTAPTGYLLYYGTNNPPTNIVNGTNLGNVLSYTTGALTIGTTYYWRIVPTNAYGNATNCLVQTFTRVSCVNMTNGSSTTCMSGFYDDGGPTGSASDNAFMTYTFCPSTAGQCIQANFYSFEMENGFDFLYVYDGNSTAAPQISGSPFTGNLTPFGFVGSTSNATGCLTFVMDTDASISSSGWDASISCSACGTTTLSAQDCAGSTPICNDQSFSGNSLGQGVVNDLNGTNMGCLSAEHQTSWYYFTVATGGTIQLSITPQNGIDDYDFAIWGPLGGLNCPMTSSPYRCSYSMYDGNTGLVNGAGDNSENALGDKWVNSMVVTAGQTYVMCIDNYSVSSQPFTLDWTFTNGASLDCSILPIELISFDGWMNEQSIELNWKTATESDNDFFTIEKSADGINFEKIREVDASGFSAVEMEYAMVDFSPFAGKNYYRLSQTDFDGTTRMMQTILVNYTTGDFTVSNLHPNPTNGEMYFDFLSLIKGTMKVEILDVTGRVVAQSSSEIEEGSFTFTAPTQSLSDGVYYLRILFDDKSTLFKIIKQ